MYSAALDRGALRAARAARRRRRSRRALDRLRARVERAAAGQRGAVRGAARSCPSGWLNALQKASAAMADHLAETPHEPPGPLQQFYFDVLAFARLAEAFGSHSLFDVTRAARPARAARRCRASATWCRRPS